MSVDKNILIVEDEFLASEYLKTILNKLGYINIFQVESCQEAKEVISKNHIDFAFMDINIKGSIDGIHCTRELNNDCNLPVIYTTVYKDLSILNDIKNTNIYGYVTKPFDLNEIFIAISILNRFIRNGNPSDNKSDSLKAEEDFYDFGQGIYFDLKKQILMANGVHIKLSHQETLVLDFFCKNPDQYLTYEILIFNLWKNLEVSHSAIRDVIYRLKQKFPGNFPIYNTQSLGYFLAKPKR